MTKNAADQAAADRLDAYFGPKVDSLMGLAREHAFELARAEAEFLVLAGFYATAEVLGLDAEVLRPTMEHIAGRMPRSQAREVLAHE